MKLVYHSDDERLNNIRIVLVGSKEKNIITEIKKKEDTEAEKNTNE